MILLDYRDARPIYSQIVDGIAQQIACGILLPGERLPSVRELATQLTINPNTIQRAYRELEAQGLIATVAGKGCYVCQTAASNEALLKEFQRITLSLLETGISREALAEMILQGGKDYAGNA